METDLEAPTVRWPAPSARTKEHFTRLGVRRCYCAFYSCKGADVLARVVVEAVGHTLPENSTFDLLTFIEEGKVRRLDIQQHFIDDALTLKSLEMDGSMQGTYLLIAVPLPDDEGPFDARVAEEVETCAAFVSLLHGEFVATERHFAAVYDLQTGDISQDSPSIYVRQIREQEGLNQGLAVTIDRSDDRQLKYNATALALLRRSHHERDATLKFLFMWLALEAVLGKGPQRRQFALEVMQSERLDQIINQLREKRDALLHDGLLVGLTHKEYLRIKCVFILGLSQSDELRGRLLAYLESELAD